MLTRAAPPPLGCPSPVRKAEFEAHKASESLAAVRQNGAMLGWAGPVPRANKRVVLAAIRKVGPAAFHQASPGLQQDPEVRAAAGFHLL